MNVLGGKRMYENRVLKRIFRSKIMEVMASWAKLVNKDFTICTPYQILIRWVGRRIWGD
jgi:hypothetical protein